MAVKLVAREDGNEKALAALDKGTTVEINKSHKIMSHVNKATLKNTSKHYNWTLTGILENYGDCYVSTISQKG